MRQRSMLLLFEGADLTEHNERIGAADDRRSWTSRWMENMQLIPLPQYSDGYPAASVHVCCIHIRTIRSSDQKV